MAENYYYSLHADIERKSDDLSFREIEEAILKGSILESYPDTGRGSSCLIVGFSANKPVHIVCGYRGESLVIITVYVPKLPKFTDPWTRGP
jgi:hypothetical protein